jgi:site-specific recombinase XerD
MVLEEKWPVLGRHARAGEWLGIWADLGRAPRTIDAYARGLAEFLQVCERDGIDPLDANRAQVAGFVRELTSRPGGRGGNVVALDSGVGLANATLVQRLVAVRLFYDFLVEEGAAGVEPGGPWPLHVRAVGRRCDAAVGLADGQAAVDPGRAAVA